MEILVGDANGIDSLVQDYCLLLNYFNVTVYSISSLPRYKGGRYKIQEKLDFLEKQNELENIEVVFGFLNEEKEFELININ